jgi:hypothetical protein
VSDPMRPTYRSGGLSAFDPVLRRLSALVGQLVKNELVAELQHCFNERLCSEVKGQVQTIVASELYLIEKDFES